MKEKGWKRLWRRANLRTGSFWRNHLSGYHSCVTVLLFLPITAYAAMFGFDNASDLIGMMLGDLLAPELREELTIRQKSRQRGFKESESFEAMGYKKKRGGLSRSILML
jgi:hypothetical protein